MKIIHDCFGRAVRWTDERIAHVLQHQEMAGMETEVEHTLQSPAEVRVSRSDSTSSCSMNTMLGRVWVGNGYVSW